MNDAMITQSLNTVVAEIAGVIEIKTKMLQ